jgi:hypothetical protein
MKIGNEVNIDEMLDENLISYNIVRLVNSCDITELWKT